jgi:acetyl esterase
MSTTTATSSAEAFTPVIEPHTQQWLNELAAASADGPPLYELSPKDARQVLLDAQASVAVELQPADIDDRVIRGGPTGEVVIRIVSQGAAGLSIWVVGHVSGWVCQPGGSSAVKAGSCGRCGM